MGCILKFRLPNLYTTIIVTKIKKDFLNKRERVKYFFIFWLCHHSSKFNVIAERGSPANEVVVELLSFPIVWISDTVNMVLLFFLFKLKIAVRKKKKIYEVWQLFEEELISFWCFFQEEFPSLLKAILRWSGKLKSKKKSRLS